MFSPDETLLAAKYGYSGSRPDTLWIWNVETGEATVNGLPEDVNPQSFSADGTMLLTLRRLSLEPRHGNIASVWNTSTGERETKEFPQEANVSHAMLSPDGRLVVTASYQGNVQVWKIGERTRNQAASVPRTTELLCPPIRHNSPVDGLKFSGDGKQLFIAGGDRVGVWELPSVSKTEVLFGRSISLSRNGSRAAYFASLNARVPYSLDLQTRASTEVRGAGPTRARDLLVDEFSDGRRGHSRWTPSIWVSDDGNVLVSAGSTGQRLDPRGPAIAVRSTFRVWNAKTGMPVSEPFEQMGTVRSLRISPNGNRIAVLSAGQPGERSFLFIHNPARGEAVEIMDSYGFRGLRDMVFTRDSNRIVFALAESIDMLDAETGEVLKRKIVRQKWIRARKSSTIHARFLLLPGISNERSRLALTTGD